ncbi:MAG: hypothetical protein JOZ24_06075 [Candidatus Eremiobacteraeota bacterium]|nr:hypothetical protein [Candidatus Eremiobacteraeota bacterium]
MPMRAILTTLVAALALPTAALAASDDLQRLAERIAGQNGTATVLLHALPKELPPELPLPAATLLGSVVQHPAAASASDNPAAAMLGSAGTPVGLYYDVRGDRKAAMQAYETRLRAAGWKPANPMARFPFPQGGFAMQLPATSIWCSAGTPKAAMTIGTPSGDATALNLSVTTAAALSGLLCGEGLGNMFPVDLFGKSPLPTLSPPAGAVAISSGPTMPGTTTSARFETSLSVADLFESFAKQLRDAGWGAGEAASSGALRSQTFRKSTDGRNYVVVLTVYALDARHDTALTDLSIAP